MDTSALGSTPLTPTLQQPSVALPTSLPPPPPPTTTTTPPPTSSASSTVQQHNQLMMMMMSKPQDVPQQSAIQHYPKKCIHHRFLHCGRTVAGSGGSSGGDGHQNVGPTINHTPITGSNTHIAMSQQQQRQSTLQQHLLLRQQQRQYQCNNGQLFRSATVVPNGQRSQLSSSSSASSSSGSSQSATMMMLMSAANQSSFNVGGIVGSDNGVNSGISYGSYMMPQIATTAKTTTTTTTSAAVASAVATSASPVATSASAAAAATTNSNSGPVAIQNQAGLVQQMNATLLADRYLLMDMVDGSTLYKCIDVRTHEELVCKVANNPCSNLLTAHFRLDGHNHVNSLYKVIQGNNQTYLFFAPSEGDLHSYVRVRKRLREPEAKRLFRQMCEVVKCCHEQGIVLRDLKLRKFVFADTERTHLRLESLEDAVVLDNPAEDLLQDKRGCPAYVSPEILKANTTYSGKAADMWSLGVILYTMLVGRYPFNDSEHASLFAKISRGQFLVPDCLTSKARCMIRSLLRREPDERITSDDILLHPWMTAHPDDGQDFQRSPSDQCVPDINFDDDQDIEYRRRRSGDGDGNGGDDDCAAPV